MKKTRKGHSGAILSLSIPTEQRLKKSVGAIHSSGTLTLIERKLANVLLYSAYDTLLTKRTHTIPVSIMCSMLGWDASNRIDHLKDALLSLQQTTLEFNLREDGHQVWESMSMLSFAHIKDGICTYRYDESLAARLFDPKMFAMISLQVQRRIDSSHALNLYENCIRYKDTNTGSTGFWTLDFFREIVGATGDSYNEFRKLNFKIIKPAIEKINEVSDIVVEVEYEKLVRTIIGLKFHVRNKTEEEKHSMQTALPGLSFTESVDEYQELRGSDAFKVLRKHGIAERLAFAWIREKGEQAVLDMVAYTESQDAKHLIKTNTGAYMKGLITAGAEFGATAYEKAKQDALEVRTITAQTEEQKNRVESLEHEYKAETARKAMQALTPEDRKSFALAWLQTDSGKGREADYDAVKIDFRDVVNRAKFGDFLRLAIKKPYTQKDFMKWLKEVKKLDPKKMGIEG
jgi:Initiator Replication protein